MTKRLKSHELTLGRHKKIQKDFASLVHRGQNLFARLVCVYYRDTGESLIKPDLAGGATVLIKKENVLKCLMFQFHYMDLNSVAR